MKTHRQPSRILLPFQRFYAIRSLLRKSETYYIAGGSSIYVPSRNEKYILSHSYDGTPIVREWPDLDGQMLFMTPGECARTELERNFPNVTRVGWPGKSVTLFDWQWPMVFSQRTKGSLVYTDINGAYHAIYSRLWLDVRFPRGRGSLHLGVLAKRLSEWKLARNSLIGIVRSRESVAYRGNRRISLRMNNPYLSPHLWATVQGVLNEVAQKALDTGSIYVNTDGYIHPVKSDIVSFQEWLTDIGLSYKTEAGEGEIVGWGNYRVASKQTRHNKTGRVWTTPPFKRVQLPYSDQPTKLIDWWKGLKDYE